jgi:uncharacterized protein with LGFP repeats
VFIYNQATAGLYNYTPYQPNAAALRAGYGSGDDCSAYGNRNFYSYFTDWFGSTHEPGAAAISDAYYRVGYQAVGAPQSEPFCGLVSGGCAQSFERGAGYWSPSTGAHIMLGAIYGSWSGTGREAGLLGYPTTDELGTADGTGRLQLFERGVVFWSPSTGAHPVRGAIRGAWAAAGADTGLLGYPTTDELGAADGTGRLQLFQGGAVFWSPDTGAYPVRGAIRAAWADQGADSGPLGYPTGGEVAAGAGVAQLFQGGVIAYTDGAGAQVVRGAVRAAWGRAGGATGPLGYPTGPETADQATGGVVQTFQGGVVPWSAATDAHAVAGGIATTWTARGGTTGDLGLPVSDERALPSGVATVQDFQKGSVFVPTGAAPLPVVGDIAAAYAAAGGVSGVLGLPVSNELTSGAARVQSFQSGAIWATAAGGAHPVRGAIGGAWAATGGVTGPLGAPTGNETAVGIGAAQSFAQGVLYWSPVTGVHRTTSAVLDAWAAAGGTGRLGEPTSDLRAVTGGQRQDFQRGYALVRANQPVQVVAQ